MAITQGSSIVTANQGVDVSLGRVTKAVEILPALQGPMPSTFLTQDITVYFSSQPEIEDMRFHAHSVVELQVYNTESIFPTGVLIKVLHEHQGVYFRVLRRDTEHQRIFARVELVNMWAWPGAIQCLWQARHKSASCRLPVAHYGHSPCCLCSSQAGIFNFAGVESLKLHTGAMVTMTPNRVYPALDWLSAVLTADETADLTLAESWTLSQGATAPAAMFAGALMDTFGTRFRSDDKIMKNIRGDVDVHMPPDAVIYAGVGGLYAMEGVPLRMPDGEVCCLPM